MGELVNLLANFFWDRIYRRFLRWWELRKLYEDAVKEAKGDERLKKAALEILRSDFFTEFVKQRTVTPEEEFAEFLSRLKKHCKDADEVDVIAFLESVYGHLATEMEGHDLWGKRSEQIAEFLESRKRTVEEPIAVQPSQQPTYISHFTSITKTPNFLDREDELAMLLAWLDDPEKTVGALIGIGGQGKTYLAAKFALECQQKGWEVRWLELPKTVDEFLRSVADEMQKVGNHYHSVVGDPNQPIDVRMDNAIRFLEGHSKRWLFVLDDFHKVSDDSDWEMVVAKFDRSCERTKILLTARREPALPLKLPTGTHELQDLPPLPKSLAQAYLEACGLQVSQDEAKEIWEKCKGNCEAMKLFAQAARRRKLADLLHLPLPDWSQNARA